MAFASVHGMHVKVLTDLVRQTLIHDQQEVIDPRILQLVLNEQVSVLQQKLCLPAQLTSKLKAAQLIPGDSAVFPSDAITWPIGQDGQCDDTFEYLACCDLSADLEAWVGDSTSLLVPGPRPSSFWPRIDVYSRLVPMGAIRHLIVLVPYAPKLARAWAKSAECWSGAVGQPFYLQKTAIAQELQRMYFAPAGPPPPLSVCNIGSIAPERGRRPCVGIQQRAAAGDPAVSAGVQLSRPGAFSSRLEQASNVLCAKSAGEGYDLSPCSSFHPHFETPPLPDQIAAAKRCWMNPIVHHSRTCQARRLVGFKRLNNRFFKRSME